MYLIAGLGNPGAEYENTRHNAGFMAVSELARQLDIEIDKRRFLGYTGSGFIGDEKVILLKPQTYMNASGQSIRMAADYYQLEPDHIVAVYDDIDLNLGNIRVRAKGSAGGHNGMKSIIACLGTQNFPRVRIGTGEKPSQISLIDYVLGHFSSAEEEIISRAACLAAEAVQVLITDGTDEAMNRYNQKKTDR